jgi:hypothetical protein
MSLFDSLFGPRPNPRDGFSQSAPPLKPLGAAAPIAPDRLRAGVQPTPLSPLDYPGGPGYSPMTPNGFSYGNLSYADLARR